MSLPPIPLKLHCAPVTFAIRIHDLIVSMINHKLLLEITNNSNIDIDLMINHFTNTITPKNQPSSLATTEAHGILCSLLPKHHPRDPALGVTVIDAVDDGLLVVGDG